MKLLTNIANLCHNMTRGKKYGNLKRLIPSAMRQWIDQQTQSGEYANASDYIRDLIRHDQREKDILRLALIEGEQSGISERSISEIVASKKAMLKRDQL